MPVPIDQIRLVTFNDEEIGMGFNSQSGDAVGTPFVGDCKPVQSLISSGQVVDASIQILTSQEELMNSMNMTFEAQGRYGSFSGSAKAKFSETTKYNSSSTFLVARCVVKNPITRGREFVLREDVAILLKSSPPRNDDFYAAFGDSFVRGLQTGGEFYAVIRITSKSSSTQSKLSTTLQAEFNGLSASGSFKAGFAEANKSTKTESEYTATMFQVSGIGIETAPTCTVEEVLQRYKTFSSIAKNSPVAYQSELATYNTVPIPLPCYEEEESYLEALRDTREQKLFYIQRKNDFEFALRNPSFFISVPNQATLVGAIDSCTKYINALVNHAIQLSKGRVGSENFFFDSARALPPIQRPPDLALEKVDTDLNSAGPSFQKTFELSVKTLAGDEVPEFYRGAPYPTLGVRIDATAEVLGLISSVNYEWLLYEEPILPDVDPSVTHSVYLNNSPKNIDDASSNFFWFMLDTPKTYALMARVFFKDNSSEDRLWFNPECKCKLTGQHSASSCPFR
jgi:hypothetical protein